MTGAELLALCKDALAAAGEAEVEVFARAGERGVARFAVGALSQHMELAEPAAIVRVARGRSVASAETSELDRDGLVSAIHAAARAARFVPETEGFPGFASAEDAVDAGAPPPRAAERTSTCTAEERVERLRPVLERVRAAGLVSAGVLETGQRAMAVATTRGAARSHDATLASFKVWALETAGAPSAAGYGGHLHRDVGALRFDEETARAVDVCSRGKDPIALPPGAYDVVMEPAAIAELLEWLGAIAFGAPDVEAGTSPLAGRLGERITGERVTLYEDPLDPGDLGFGAPFDREGTSRIKAPLIERGVARTVLYDRTYAARAGVRSTGSALGDLGGSVGPSSLSLEGGDAESADELLAGVERGLYVCRLHYVNGLMEPRRAVMTGLTRDGCFLVENGKVTRPVGNLRFTDSLLEGLARADGMTRARVVVPTWWSEGGTVVAPAVRMRGFRFNGGSARAGEVS